GADRDLRPDVAERRESKKRVWNSSRSRRANVKRFEGDPETGIEARGYWSRVGTPGRDRFHTAVARIAVWDQRQRSADVRCNCVVACRCGVAGVLGAGAQGDEGRSALTLKTRLTTDETDMKSILTDIRFGLRGLVRQPGFT